MPALVPTPTILPSFHAVLIAGSFNLRLHTCSLNSIKQKQAIDFQCINSNWKLFPSILQDILQLLSKFCWMDYLTPKRVVTLTTSERGGCIFLRYSLKVKTRNSMRRKQIGIKPASFFSGIWNLSSYSLEKIHSQGRRVHSLACSVLFSLLAK